MKRTLPVVAIAAVLTLLPLLISPAAATSFSNPTPMNGQGPMLGDLLVPFDVYPSNISVSGLSGSVTDVNVTICGFSATFPSDANVMLVAPNGTNAIVMADVGGNGNDSLADPEHDVPITNVTLTLDDAAASPLPADSALSSGTFRPVDDDIGELELNGEPDRDEFPPPAPVASANVALSSFNGGTANGTWALYAFDDFPAQASDGELVQPNFSCGWSIDVTTSGGGVTTTTTPGATTTTTAAPTTTTSTVPPDTTPPPADFDGDGDSDVSVYRPSNALWFVQGGLTTGWGTAGDIPVPADYDGDGDVDVAVFRPSTGVWFVQGGPAVAWGTSGDIPVPGDYDGDGDAEIAVFRPSTGVWFVQGGPVTGWGGSGDIPVPGDYDGDGDTDLAVFRPSTGVWFVQGGPVTGWGASGDIPVPGDYDGDGDTDIAVYRSSAGVWFVQGIPPIAWGTSGDIPVPGDYDGADGVNIAVFRPSDGVWYFRQGGTAIPFGTSGDVPLPLPDHIRRFFFPPL